MHNKQKKIALINDLTGFGRCSVAVQLPIISQMGVQCCVLPTSILSNHTGFETYSFHDFTQFMREYIAEWRKLDLQFAGICTGFLGSAEQIDIVRDFIDEFKRDNTAVVVDPVMGDYGKPYATYTAEMCTGMLHLVERADIITPNLTEACILAGQQYKAHMSLAEVQKLAKHLSELGPRNVVITGIAGVSEDEETIALGASKGVSEGAREGVSELAGKVAGKDEGRDASKGASVDTGASLSPGADTGEDADVSVSRDANTNTNTNTSSSMLNVCYERATKRSFVVSAKRLGDDRSGTGDVFSAIIAACAVRGVPFQESVERAQAFVATCVKRSIELDIPLTDGVSFEEVLRFL